MSELINKVREALIALVYQEGVELYHDPEFKERLMHIFRGMAEELAKRVIDEDDDLDDSDFEEITEDALKDMKESVFGSEDQIRTMAFQNAKNGFTTKEELVENFDRQMAEKFEGEELDEEDEEMLEKLRTLFNEFLDNLQESFDFTDELLSTFTELAEKEGIEKVVTSERKNLVIKTIIPSREEYLAMSLSTITAAQEYFKKLQAFLKEMEVDDDDDDDDDDLIGVELDLMTKLFSSIGEDMLKYGADKIYRE